MDTTALNESLACHGDLAGGSGAAVLLIPGTTPEPPLADYARGWQD